jgi:hypothetical protein
MTTFKAADMSRLDGDLRSASADEISRLAEAARQQLARGSGQITVARAANLQQALIKARLFDGALRFSASLDAAQVTSSLLAKLHVQALIDTGQLARATDETSRLLQEILPSDPQYLELRGLAGRVAKQRYINAALVGTAREDDLTMAIGTYLTAYDTDPKHPAWHGINAVALLARAQRDGVAHTASARTAEIAGGILARIRNAWQAGDADYWDIATAAEAALALGQDEAAELWLHRYVEHPDLPAFALASTLRQYREVWQLGPRSSSGTVLLPVLERRLAAAGQIQMSLEDARAGAYSGNFEKVFGKASFLSHAKYMLGAERAKAVARVEDKQGDPQGTGFLMRGAELSDRFKDYTAVLLTNAHVISADDPRAAIYPDDARFAFFGANPGGAASVPVAKVKKVLWSSPSSELDTTIILLDQEVPGAEPCPTARALPKPGPDSKVFIIGYPSGGGLNYSLFDNQLLGFEDTGPKVHYRTPTEPGSSGSPVFNQNWELIAIHHSGAADMQSLHGSETYEANEGMQIRFIRQALAG